MISIFESVEDIWVIWLITASAFSYCVIHATRQLNWRSMCRFVKSEDGASYTLPFVLTFPIYLLLMAVLIQATLILMCKIGTTYSAYCAARTVVVWKGHEPESSENFEWQKYYLRYKAKRSATMAMVPFANSYEDPRKKLFPWFPINLADVDPSDLASVREFIEKGATNIDIGATFANILVTADKQFYRTLYGELNSDAHSQSLKDKKLKTSGIIQNKKSKVRDSYIDNKYDYAAAATWIDVPDDFVKWNDDVAVTVTYRMAFHIPGTAKILRGDKRPWSRYLFRDISSTVILPSESANTEAEDGRIGIPYNTYYLKPF